MKLSQDIQYNIILYQAAYSRVLALSDTQTILLNLPSDITNNLIPYCTDNGITYDIGYALPYNPNAHTHTEYADHLCESLNMTDSHRVEETQ